MLWPRWPSTPLSTSLSWAQWFQPYKPPALNGSGRSLSSLELPPELHLHTPVLVPGVKDGSHIQATPSCASICPVHLLLRCPCSGAHLPEFLSGVSLCEDGEEQLNDLGCANNPGAPSGTYSPARRPSYHCFSTTITGAKWGGPLVPSPGCRGPMRLPEKGATSNSLLGPWACARGPAVPQPSTAA